MSVFYSISEYLNNSIWHIIIFLCIGFGLYYIGLNIESSKQSISVLISGASYFGSYLLFSTAIISLLIMLFNYSMDAKTMYKNELHQDVVEMYGGAEVLKEINFAAKEITKTTNIDFGDILDFSPKKSGKKNIRYQQVDADIKRKNIKILEPETVTDN